MFGWGWYLERYETLFRKNGVVWVQDIRILMHKFPYMVMMIISFWSEDI